MATKRNKKYKPKRIMLIPRIDPLIRHHSGYEYKKSQEPRFLRILNMFAQDIYTAHITGVKDYNTCMPLSIEDAPIYQLLYSDHMSGLVNYEYHILEE